MDNLVPRVSHLTDPGGGKIGDSGIMGTRLCCGLGQRLRKEKNDRTKFRKGAGGSWVRAPGFESCTIINTWRHKWVKFVAGLRSYIVDIVFPAIWPFSYLHKTVDE